MLTYHLEESGDIPKYIYLYQLIRNDIIAGKIKGGERLPSKRAFASHLNVGNITVANAYDQLVAEGYIYSEERKGYFVEHGLKSISATDQPSSENEDINEKGTDVPPSNPDEEEEHEFFADFNSNRINLDLFPKSVWNQLMRQTLDQRNETLYRTIPYKGLFELRKAIADYLHYNRGMTVSPSQIIVGAGTEYLYGRLSQMFGRACTFGFEDPGYKTLAALVASYGSPCRFISMDENGIMMDELEDSGADVVHISPSNHFPTGTIMSIGRRRELLDWSYKARKRYIIEDDYDSEFHYKGTYIPPLYTIDTQEKVIYMNTFSKTMIPALRISYMVLPKKLMERYKDTLSFYSCSVSSFEQHTLAKFMSEGYLERHINRLKTYYSSLRKKVLEAIRSSRLNDITDIVEHGSGTHMLLYVRTTLTEEEIVEAKSKLDIQFKMYSSYSQKAPGPEDPRILVLNYAGINTEKLEDMIARLEQIFPECRK